MNIIETARKIIHEGPICDHCLGRQFAKLSTGFSNDERGRALKIFLAMAGDIEKKENGDTSILSDLSHSFKNARRTLGTTGEEETCWVCGNLFSKTGFWAQKGMESLEGYEYSSFLVGTLVTGLLTENEEILWAVSGTVYAEPLKTELNREVGKIIEARTGKKANLLNPEIVVLLDIENDRVLLQVNSMYISGRYRKLVRGIPQTRWPCRECEGQGCERCGFTGKMYSESVDELIKGPVMEVTGGTDTVFHGAGREDIDALMVGDGRPFVVEARNPRVRNIDLTALKEAINTGAEGKIEVLDLKSAEKSLVEELKTTKIDKEYRLKVEFGKPVSWEKLKSSLDIVAETEIRQKTPVRVLHRRADHERIRRVHRAEIESFADTTAIITISCEGGLYVKEMVSGDNGRTVPSLSALLETEAKVIELEVIKVCA